MSNQRRKNGQRKCIKRLTRGRKKNLTLFNPFSKSSLVIFKGQKVNKHCRAQHWNLANAIKIKKTTNIRSEKMLLNTL